MDRSTCAGRPGPRQRGAAPLAIVAVASAVGLLTLLAPGAPRVAAERTTTVGSGIEECVADRMQGGESRPEAMANCLRENASPTTKPDADTPTTKPDDDAPVTTDRDAAPVTTSGDDGTSLGLLAAVGAAGLVIGAGVALALRRSPASGAAAAGATAAGFSPPPASAPAPVAAPAPAAPAAPATPDRSPGLVRALVDLGDRVSSGALRAEIVAALAGAGVQTIEPQQGEPFDAARMRGVGATAAPDPSWIGRVAAVERAGYHDRGQLLRLPEVVVYTTEG